MKMKISKVFMIIVIFLQTVVSINNLVRIQTKDLENPFKKASHAFVNLPATVVKDTEVFKAILETAQQKNIVMAKSIYNDTDLQTEVVVYTKALHHVIEKFEGYSIGSHIDTIMVNADKETENPKTLHVQTIKKDFLSTYDNAMKIRLLMDEEMDAYAGQFSIYGDSKDALEAFATYISKTTDIPYEAILIPFEIIPSDSMNTLGFSGVTVLMTFIALFTLVGEYMKQSKVIGVKKMLGYSDFSIMMTYLMKWFCTSMLYAIGSFILAGVVIEYFSVQMFVYIFRNILTMLLASAVCVGCVSFYITKKITISALIKQKNILFGLEIANFLVKGVAIVVLGILFGGVITLVRHHHEKIVGLNRYQSYNPYFTFTTTSLGNDFEEENIFDKEKFYQDIVLKNDGIYSDFSSFECEHAITKTVHKGKDCYGSEAYVFAIVNERYLSDYTLETKKSIETALQKNGLVLLVPKDLSSSNSDIIENIKARYGLDFQHDMIEYTGNINFFTMNPQAAEESGYLQKDPIFVVFNQKVFKQDAFASFISLKLDGFFGQGATTAFKFKIPGNEKGIESWYRQNVETLNQLGLNDNLLSDNIEDVSSPLLSMIESLECAMKVHSLLLVIMLLVLVLTLTYAINLFLISNHQKIVVKKFLGKTNVRIFSNYLQSLVFVDGGSLLLLLWIFLSQNMFNGTTLIYFGIVGILEGLNWCIFIRHNLKKNVVMTLKGA